MKRSENGYEPHLVIRDVTIHPGVEWVPGWSGWSVIRVRGGTAYHLRPSFNSELEIGAVLVLGAGTPGSIRASQLGIVHLSSFSVIPSRLTGLMTLGEQQFFKNALPLREPSVFPPDHKASMKMAELCEERGKGIVFRLKLLELFAELFGKQPEKIITTDSPLDARKRLENFLEETPSSELLEMNFNELARKMLCTERHLSRIFHELVGMSFRDKRAELRLIRARELLATTNAKVVDVALESGYKSLSLFNLMFSRKFKISPGKWRKQQAVSSEQN